MKKIFQNLNTTTVNTALPASEEKTQEQGAQQKEPTVIVKKEKYTLLRMLCHVLIYTLILALLYFSLPFEIVVISSSSMQPELPVGSLSIAIETDENTEYRVGDIITFATEYNGTYYSRITHRIVAIDGDLITTKGDANPENDPFTIHKSQIRNRVKWKNILKI